MRISCVGGGPAGLYFAILMKRRDPDHEITVFERDPAGETYGWGVVFWDDLLVQLQENDPQTARDIDEHSFRWEDQVVHVQDRTAHLGGYGFSTSRQTLLDILARRAIALGVDIRFEHDVDDLSELAGSDLIVACDGVNSWLRGLHADRFGTSVTVGRNKYIWLGTSKVFDSFTFPFVHTEAGWIWFHAYGFNSEASTFIVECSPETWAGLGLDGLGPDESIALLQRTFARQLDGHPLMVGGRDPDRMPWLSFRTVTNRRWHHDNIALMGDAAHTTHFTIGSGTRLAIEDAIALAGKLEGHEGLQPALDAYERERKLALRLPGARARYSARWFESVPRYVDLETREFAALLIRRFSRLLPYMPPQWYYRLYEAARRFEVLRRLRSWIRSKPRLNRLRGG